MATPDIEFRHRSPEELFKQVQDVSSILGTSIAPPSIATAEIISTSPDQLKDRLPRRYDIYVGTLRNIKAGNDRPHGNARDIRVITALNALDRFIQKHQSGEIPKTLYDRQMTVFEDLWSFLEQGGMEGYIKLPTGTGKTVLFTKFIEATGLRTLILTPTRLLVEQTRKRIAQFAQEMDVGLVYSDEKDYGRHVTIATYVSAIKGVRNGHLNPDDYDLVILDEAHTALTELRTDFVHSFPKAVKIGFTATPYYFWDKQVRNLLPVEIHTMSVTEAVNEELLSPFSVIIASTDVDLSKIEINAAGCYNEVQLERAVNITRRNQAAIELYEKRFQGKKAVVHCVGVKHAAAVAQLFNEKGIPAGILHGKLSKSKRKEILDKYSAGEIKVICSARMLIHGFDDAVASVCFNLKPTLSQVDAEQRAGRVLRIDPNDTSKHAVIVDFIDRTSNTKESPISFADIVGNAYVSNKTPDRRTLGIDVDLSVQNSRTVDLSVAGITVTVHPDEVMRILRERTAQILSPPPDGWLHMSQITAAFITSDRYVQSIIGELRLSHPEYFGRYLSQRGSAEYYSPEIVDIVKAQIIQRQKPPDGWLTKDELAGKLGITSHRIMDSLLAPLSESKIYQTDIGVFTGANSMPTTFYSPVIMGLLEQNYHPKNHAPEGWLTISGLERKFGIQAFFVQLRIDVLRASRQDNFGTFADGRGRPREHFSPDVIQILKSEWDKRKKPPEGWMNTNQLRKLGLNPERTSILVDDYRSSNPEYFGMFTTERDVLTEYFAPPLVSIARTELEKTPLRPAGWMTENQLRKLLVTSSEVTRRLIEKHTPKYPDGIRSLKGKSGLVGEYLSPELLHAITTEYHQIRRKKH
jgi:superfamily II DNA or RNA helicase